MGVSLILCQFNTSWQMQLSALDPRRGKKNKREREFKLFAVAIPSKESLTLDFLF